MMDQLQMIQSVYQNQKEQVNLTKALIHRVNSLDHSEDMLADIEFIHQRLSKCESHLSEMNYLMHHLISCMECQIKVTDYDIIENQHGEIMEVKFNIE